jgi:hypothetical protein
MNFLGEHPLPDKWSVGTGVYVAGSFVFTHVENASGVHGTPVKICVTADGTDSDKFAPVHLLSSGEHGESD